MADSIKIAGSVDMAGSIKTPDSILHTVEVSIAESINVEDDEVPPPSLLKKWVTTTSKVSLSALPIMVSLRITDEEEIQQLNYQFRQKNQPTNVLSFPLQKIDEAVMADMNYLILGDIVLCATVIKQQAKDQGKTTLSHWAHMVIHGMLHLQGYDHIQADQAEQMEQLEISLLNKLGYINPYQ